MGEWFSDLAAKLFHVGKLMVPGIAVFEIVRWLFATWLGVGGWIRSKIDALLVDVTVEWGWPVGSWLDHVNSVFPLYEGFGYLLLYFSIMLGLVTVKWVRNLTPGIS